MCRARQTHTVPAFSRLHLGEKGSHRLNSTPYMPFQPPSVKRTNEFDPLAHPSPAPFNSTVNPVTALVPSRRTTSSTRNRSPLPAVS